MIKPEDAIGIIIDTDLSKHKYQKIRVYTISAESKKCICYSHIH